MAWAMTSAVMVVPLALQAVHNWQPDIATHWTTTHRRALRARQNALFPPGDFIEISPPGSRRCSTIVLLSLPGQPCCEAAQFHPQRNHSMSLSITAIGTAVPEHIGDQQLALAVARDMCAENADHDKKLRVIYGRSGIQKRHSVLHELTLADLAGNGTSNKSVVARNGNEVRHDFYVPARGSGDRGPTTRSRMERYEAEVVPLATRAAVSALEQSSLSADDFTHLVTVSCTGFNAPGFDVALIKELGLPPGIQRTHIGYMGCHGALNGLRVARSFLEADSEATVLLCAAELCTLHLYYGWHTERMIANALFADGAAAIVGVPASRADKLDWQVIDNASLVLDGHRRQDELASRRPWFRE